MAITIDSWYPADTILHRQNAIYLAFSTDLTFDNLSARVQVYDYSTQVPTLITTLNPHFDDNGQSYVIISSLVPKFRKTPNLSLSSDRYQYGQNASSPPRIRVRIAEQHSVPLETEPTVETSEIQVIDGYIDPIYNTVYNVPDVFVAKQPAPFVKLVHPGMQDYIYAISSDIAASSWDIVWYDANGVEHTVNTSWPNNAPSIMINCGPLNLAQAYGIDITDVVRYAVKINDTLVAEYELMAECHPYQFVVGVLNGRGCAEFHYFYGKKESTSSVQKQQIQTYTTSESRLRGSYDELINSGRTTIKVHTGYHSKEYIEYLRSIISNTCYWIIDNTNDGSVRMNTVTNKVIFKKDDQDLSSLEVEFALSLNNYPYPN